ncbi:MAG: uncharacterized protein K0R34_2059 [Herbinix sp.]|jgi:hypothetical protein|nr:uncharacterized protein [Herbinix sp.]
MNHMLNQQLKQIELQEQKIFNQMNHNILESTLTPMFDKIQDKIPDKLVDTLNSAFYKGFQLVFEKGSTYIEKTYNKDKIELEHDINNYALDKRMNKRHFKRLDQYSKQSKLINSSFSVLEGSVLGVLGIGIPDIPLLLSVLVKTIYEIALSYGYSYDTEAEKAYLLLLINAAIAKGELQKDLDKKLELFSDKLDRNIEASVDVDEQMKDTAKALSDVLLTAKFIQGIPIVGVVGGAVNYSIVNRVARYARLKYKKRYLLKKLVN